MNSCLYRGYVQHHRDDPVQHRFRYPLFTVCLDLDELETLTARGSPLARRFLSWASFRRSDHLGDPNQPLDESVRDLVAEETGQRPEGPIRLLTQLRYFGFYFSPLNVYYCYKAGGEEIESIVAEVNNTPWRERHCYVLWSGNRTGSANQLRFAHKKNFHVSPFMGMDSKYNWRLSNPGSRVFVGITTTREGVRFFDASLAMKRKPLSRSQLRRMLLRFPWMTAQIVIAIYFEALRLWLKKCPCFPHPQKSKPLVAAKP